MDQQKQEEQKKEHEKKVTLFHHYQQVLEVVDEALHALLNKKIKSFDELKDIEKLYKNARALFLQMPQSKGRDVIGTKLLKIYQIMEKTRHNLYVAEYNEKAHFVVNLLHQAELELEDNNTKKAMKIYTQIVDVFSHLPETNKLDKEKQQNLKRQIKELHQKISFSQEIDYDTKLNKIMYRIHNLMQLCEQASKTDKAKAEKIFNDLTEVYDHLPEGLINKKVEIQQKIEQLRAKLTGTEETSLEEFQLPSFLVFALHQHEHLKSQEAFKELIRGLANLHDHKETGNLQAAQHSYEQARKAFFELEGEKEKLHKLVIKARDSLILLSEAEKLKNMKEKSDIAVHLAKIRRMTLDYNATYPEDTAFTDTVYKKCDAFSKVVDEEK